jgi:hypothetical protein
VTPAGSRSALLAALVFAVALASLSRIRVSAQGDEPAFYPDEASKLADARYAFLLLEPGGARDPAWSERFYARTNPPLGGYATGLALALAGQRVGDLALQDSFDALWRDPAALRRQVPDAWLAAGRRESALFGALACAALALAAASAGGVAAGAVSALLLLGHAGFDRFARLALSDSLLLFALALALLAFTAALRALAPSAGGAGATGSRTPKTLGPRAAFAARTVLIPGACVAFAAAVKPNGALLGFAWALTLLASALLAARPPGPGPRLARALGLGAGAALVAFALFVALDPYLHRAPLAKLAESAAVWRDWMLKQQLDPGGALYAPLQRVALLAHATLRAKDLLLVRALGEAGRWLGLALFAVGIGSLAGCATRRSPAGEGAPAAPALAALAWSLALLFGIGAWLPIVRPAYLLPPVLAACLVQGVGAAEVARMIRGALRRGRWARRAGSDSAARESADLPRAWSPSRRAAAVALAAAIALGLAPVSPLVDASLLHPILVPDAMARPRLAGYERAALAHPESAVRRYHFAIALGLRGRYAEGAREFEAALALLPAHPPDAGAQVLRADLLLDLALFREALGEADAAARARARHLEALARLRDGMRTRDPFVLAEFDLMVESRRRSSRP